MGGGGGVQGDPPPHLAPLAPGGRAHNLAMTQGKVRKVEHTVTLSYLEIYNEKVPPPPLFTMRSAPCGRVPHVFLFVSYLSQGQTLCLLSSGFSVFRFATGFSSNAAFLLNLSFACRIVS